MPEITVNDIRKGIRAMKKNKVPRIMCRFKQQDGTIKDMAPEELIKNIEQAEQKGERYDTGDNVVLYNPNGVMWP